jgi:hypothetical protein
MLVELEKVIELGRSDSKKSEAPIKYFTFNFLQLFIVTRYIQ